MANIKTDLVFISGPMTGLPNYNYDEFNRVTNLLRAMGVKVINPAEVGVQPEWEWSDYLRESLDGIINNKVTHVITLKDWEKSKGAKLEVHVARELGAKILDMHEYIRDLGKTHKESKEG